MSIDNLDRLISVFVCLVCLPELVLSADYQTINKGDLTGSHAKLGSLTTQTTKLLDAGGEEDDEFGYSVSISGDTAVIGAWLDDDSLGDSGSAYIFSRNQGGLDAWDQVANLTTKDSQPNDLLGFSVSISGDTVVAGAPGDDDKGNGSGAAYIFLRNFVRDPNDQNAPDLWGQIAKLTASDGVANDAFGFSVAISDDTVVVGARNANELGVQSGSAYIFSRNQGGANAWGQVTELVPVGGAAGDFFGHAVAISGDTVVVGARFDDDQGTNSGSAYIFSRNQGGANAWGQVAKLTANDGIVNDDFGYSVAISGDTVVVGARTADELGVDSGSAYIFSRNQGGENVWGQVTELVPVGGTAGDVFGFSVAISGDTAVVGARFDDDRGTDSGSAYIFSRNQDDPSAWGQIAKLTANDGATDDRFGFATSISGDIVVIGSPCDDDQGIDNNDDQVPRGSLPDCDPRDDKDAPRLTPNSGSAYVFQINRALNIPATPTTTLNIDQGDSQLGFATANVGDINGDGYSDLVTGLPLFDTDQIDVGAVQLFLGTPDGISGNAADQQLEGDLEGAQFGFAVAGIGDIDNDGFFDVAVGAPFFADGEVDEGAVFIYRGSLTGLQTPAFRILQSDQAGAMLGFSVAGAGDTNGDGFADVVMGMPGFASIQQNQSSRGPISDRVGAFATLLGNLANAVSNIFDVVIEGTESNGELGTSVAGAGDVNRDGKDDVIAGAPNINNGNMPNAGMAAVYPGSESGPNTTALARFFGNTANAKLGTSVIGLGDVDRDGFDDVAAGAPGYTNGQANEGGIFLYRGDDDINTEAQDILESNRPDTALGTSLATVADLNSDGVKELMGGAPDYSNNQIDEGAAYVYQSLAASFYDDEPRTILEADEGGAQLGRSVAGISDLNVTGFTQLVTGAPLSDRNQLDAGRLNIYRLTRSLLSPNNTILFDDFEP